MSRTLKIAENRHYSSEVIWIQVTGSRDLKMIGKLPCLIFGNFLPISANSHQRHVAYGVLRFSQLPGLNQCPVLYGMVAFVRISKRTLPARKRVRKKASAKITLAREQ